MQEGRKNPFLAPSRQLKTELAALVIVVAVAGGLASLDLRGAAHAAGSEVSAAQAISIARDYGLEPQSVRGETAQYSPEYGLPVWRVHGTQDAVIDATTGELLEVGF